jgi:hypothetical protein
MYRPDLLELAMGRRQQRVQDVESWIVLANRHDVALLSFLP